MATASEGDSVWAIIPKGLAYNLQPEGATFDPPIKLVMSYDETRVFQLGVSSEGELTAAYYDTRAMGWKFVYGTLDMEANVITIPLYSTLRSVCLVGTPSGKTEYLIKERCTAL